MFDAVLKAAFLAAFVLASAQVWGQETASIVLVSAPESTPVADDVRDLLQGYLNRVEVRVDVHGVEVLPNGAEEWRTLSSRVARKEPGTIAVFGWTCETAEDCELAVVDTASSSVCVVPVKPRPLSDDDDGPAEERDPGEDEVASDGVAMAIAATIREVVWGEMLLEMRRLAAEGRNPSTPPPDVVRPPEPYVEASSSPTVKRRERGWLWLEGGYHGNYAAPQGDPVHGPWLGIALSPVRYLVVGLDVGWLGMRNVDVVTGSVSLHRVPVELQLRLAIPVGLSLFSVGAVGRLDMAFYQIDPVGPRGQSSDSALELHVGGETMWCFPLPGDKVDVMVGAGILAAILSDAIRLDGVTAIEASDFRITWRLGIAWSPL